MVRNSTSIWNGKERIRRVSLLSCTDCPDKKTLDFCEAAETLANVPGTAE